MCKCKTNGYKAILGERTKFILRLQNKLFIAYINNACTRSLFMLISKWTIQERNIPVLAELILRIFLLR